MGNLIIATGLALSVAAVVGLSTGSWVTALQSYALAGLLTYAVLAVWGGGG